MKPITVEHNPAPAKLEVMGVDDWPVWTKEPSRFPWTYDATEVCYILEGRVTVTPEGGEAVDLSAGDLVTFTKGLKCTWEIHEAIKKHYSFK